MGKVLDMLLKTGEEISDLNQDIMQYKGSDFKNMSIQDTFYFCKANATFKEPGISYDELRALHEASELYGHKPATIVETGMCFGVTTRYWIMRNLKYGGNLNTFEVYVRELFKADMEDLGLWNNITLKGHSMKDNWQGQIDILYIDSEHALQDALGEYMRFRVWLHGGSIIGFHDTDVCPGVNKALEMINEVDELELISESTNQAGAGIKFFKPKYMNRIDRDWQKR